MIQPLKIVVEKNIRLLMWALCNSPTKRYSQYPHRAVQRLYSPAARKKKDVAAKPLCTWSSTFSHWWFQSTSQIQITPVFLIV